MLTPKQKAFADEYLICGNATKAARKAGYSEKTARVIGQENLQKPAISAYIAERQEQVSSKRIATIEEVMQYFTRVMNGEEKDQFGLDAPLSERTKAAQEIAKRMNENRRFELELAKLESQLKEGQQEQKPDNTFIDALKGEVPETWEEDGEDD